MTAVVPNSWQICKHGRRKDGLSGPAENIPPRKRRSALQLVLQLFAQHGYGVMVETFGQESQLVRACAAGGVVLDFAVR